MEISNGQTIKQESPPNYINHFFPMIGSNLAKTSLTLLTHPPLTSTTNHTDGQPLPPFYVDELSTTTVFKEVDKLNIYKIIY